MPQQLAASELSCEQSLLDKALKEFVEKIDKAEKTCEKLMLMILIEKSKILEEKLQNALKTCMAGTLKG